MERETPAPNNQMRAALLCALALGLVATGAAGKFSRQCLCASKATHGGPLPPRSFSSPTAESWSLPAALTKADFSGKHVLLFITDQARQGGAGLRAGKHQAPMATRHCLRSGRHSINHPYLLLPLQERYTQHFPPNWGASWGSKTAQSWHQGCMAAARRARTRN